MSDETRRAMGITDREMFDLHTLWGKIAPLEPTGWECRMREQAAVMPSDWWDNDTVDLNWTYGAMIERDNQRAYGMREDKRG